jgi:hypothetical protein
MSMADFQSPTHTGQLTLQAAISHIVTPAPAPHPTRGLDDLLAASSRGEAVTLDQFKSAVSTSLQPSRKRMPMDDDDTDDITTVKLALIPTNESLLNSKPVTTMLTDLTEPDKPTVELRRDFPNRLRNPTFRDMVLKWYKQINKVWHTMYGRGLNTLHRSGNNRPIKIYGNTPAPEMQMDEARVTATTQTAHFLSKE